MVFKLDTNAVLHGLFLAKSELAGGRLRMPRLLSGFIEASDVQDAASGGVKNDHVIPGKTQSRARILPRVRQRPLPPRRVHRETTRRILQPRSCSAPRLRSGGRAETFLIALALFKIRRFLKSGLRLRTACDLDVEGELKVTRPDEFAVPDEKALADLLKVAGGLQESEAFADDPVTRVVYEEKKKESGPIPDTGHCRGKFNAVSIALTFPGGRFHATRGDTTSTRRFRSGRLRRGDSFALVAVWKRKLPHLTRAAVEGVLSELARTCPAFHLPPATLGHTRH